MSVVAKFHVYEVHATEYAPKVIMRPVSPESSDRAHPSQQDENERFFEATPSGELWMQITNGKAAEQFQPGDEFYVTFERVQKDVS